MHPQLPVYQKIQPLTPILNTQNPIYTIYQAPQTMHPCLMILFYLDLVTQYTTFHVLQNVYRVILLACNQAITPCMQNIEQFYSS